MFTSLLKQFLKKTAFMAVCTSFMLVITTGAVQAAATCAITTNPANATIDEGQSVDFTGTIGGKGKKTCDWTFAGGEPAGATSDCTVSVTYASAGDYTARLDGTASKESPSTCFVEVTVTVNPGGGNTPPTANDDAYNATTAQTLNVAAPGVLGNDTDDGQLDPLVVSALPIDVSNGTLNLNNDGSFDYTSDTGFEGNDSFTYEVSDGEFTDTATVTITVTDVPPAGAECSDGLDNDGDGFTDFPADSGCDDADDNNERDIIDIGLDQAQTDFKIMMNYELGMHCTGFEFAYCCVIPVYNSILAQVVKPNQGEPQHGGDFPMLLEGDPNVGRDGLHRETVLRDKSGLDASGNFKKYVLTYWHDAQPRNDGRGKPQISTMISAVEGNSLQSWNTLADAVATNPIGSDDGIPDGSVTTGDYNNVTTVVGDGDYSGAGDNYQNAVFNHLYIYADLEGSNPNGSSAEADKIRLGKDITYPVDCGAALHPMGPVTSNGQSIGDDPDSPLLEMNTCGGASNGNVLTFSADTGTVVFTQMKVLENLPIMLTSPRIWEALGLPLTPFEDTIDFFADPGLVDEDSVRPFVAMKTEMHYFDPDDTYAGNDPDGSNDAIGVGATVLDGSGNPVRGFGTAPIDIPNCERCHSNPVDGSMIANSEVEGGGMLTVVNSPNNNPDQWTAVANEYAYWMSVYPGMATGADWYARLKSAAISIISGHDAAHGTNFAANYPNDGADPLALFPGAPADSPVQATRLGKGAVICQRCHAQHVVAAVKSASCGAAQANNTHEDAELCAEGTLISSSTEALHNNHRVIGAGGPIVFADAEGRDGGCQGCHPAHRSDGDMSGYPITLAGANANAGGDNRGNQGGCFVGRDVHSNPGKDSDGAETPEHLNAVGQWLADNVSDSPGENTGLWCTNCHNQLGQEMWKAENMVSTIHQVPGLQADLVTPAVDVRALPTLAAIAAAVGTTEEQAIHWIDPKDSVDRPLGDFTAAIWDKDPGLCDYVGGYVGGAVPPAHDGNVATVEVVIGPSGSGSCSNAANPNAVAVPVDCGFVQFDICGSTDVDGDFNVNLAGNTEPDAGPFGGALCTTPDCVASAQALLGPCALEAGDNCAVPVPMSTAADGRDHWLSPGEPHCADCHAAPYVEQSGNINAFPPFNYPRKASLMRYSRGHQDITCQGCHESIHGLYPVTPNIDTTTYAQAAALNHDGSHGPLKCGTCHEVDRNGIPTWMSGVKYNGNRIRTYDDAVSWMHTFTDEVSPLEPEGVCENCHGDRSDKIAEDAGKWLRHSFVGRIGRDIQDKAEIAAIGWVAGDPDHATGATDADKADDIASRVCSSCHSLQGGPSGAFLDQVASCSTTWKSHNVDGRVSEKVWEFMSITQSGDTCGW